MEGQPNGNPNPSGQQRRPRPPEQEFFGRVSAMATRQLTHILGTDAGKKAAYTIATAMLSAMRTSKNPRAFLEVTEASIADCIATSYETGLNPGGPNAVVYLVPQAPRQGAQPELQWRITHRGLAILAARAGFGVLAVPVARTDHLQVAFGEATEHDADPAAWPERLEDLLGCILVVRRISDGLVIARPWMPMAAIDQRRQKARDQGVWQAWPIEQAQKTVIKWGFARGYVPIDSPELREALSADNRGEIIETTAVTVGTGSEPRGMEALGVRRREPERPALPDHGPGVDYTAEAARLNERERVPVEEERPPAAPGHSTADEPSTRRPPGYATKLGALGWGAGAIDRMTPAAMRAAIAGSWTPQTHEVTAAGELTSARGEGGLSDEEKRRIEEEERRQAEGDGWSS